MPRRILHDHAHPIWKIALILAVCLLLLTVNYANANKFDHDDIMRVVESAGGIGALVIWWFKREAEAKKNYRCSACFKREDEE